MIARVALLVLLLSACACARGLPSPVALTSSEACAFCRMAVSDRHLAAQIVAVGEEPMFFDDIGCLAKWLKDNRSPEGAVAFVTDHRNGTWTLAETAVYTKAAGLATPMGSGIIAHENGASRDADDAAHGGALLTVAQVFGAAKVPGVSDAR